MVDIAPDSVAISVRQTPLSPYGRRLKRIIDIAVLVAFAPVVGPLLIVLCVLIRADGGPAFFGHERVGRDGRVFRCWKLRSMVPDAEGALKRYLSACPEAAEEWLRSWKLSQDPRVTKIGRFLRRTSLDELPQLWNVARGEMSLIGPRPITSAELAHYPRPSAEAYRLVRPGITGLWQVAGRNSLSPQERMALDRRYVEGLSFLGDLKILLRTGPAVLRGGS